ncbi:hypothetical protein [Nitratifractor sp.]
MQGDDLSDASPSRFLFLCFVSFFFVAKQRKRNEEEGMKSGIIEKIECEETFGTAKPTPPIHQ